MFEENSALSSLLKMAEDPCPEKRGHLLEALTDLYIEELPRLTSERRALLGDVLELLAYSLPSRSREKLARRMADIEEAPANLIQHLARDIAHVARPVLRQSTHLSNSDLLEILSGCDHLTAQAIAERSDLCPEVVHRLFFFEGCATVLINNKGVTFSYDDFRDLYDIVSEDPTLHQAFLDRKDIPADILNALLFAVDPTDQTRILVAIGELTDEDIEHALALSNLQFTSRSFLDAGLVAQAKRNANNMNAIGTLDPIHLVDQLRQGCGVDFIAALSELADLDFSFTEQVLNDPNPTGLALLCRAIGFQKAIFSTIVLLSDSSKKRSPEQVRQAMSLYPTITDGAANRVLRFWRHFSTPLDKVEAA